MMSGMTLWMLVWGLVGVLVLAAAALGVVWLVRHLDGADPAERDLRRQYATGQIDDEEFQRRLDLLRRSTRPLR